MKTWNTIKAWLEYLQGLGETPPRELSTVARTMLLGLWWTFLALAIAFFSGQTSKFIYIDF